MAATVAPDAPNPAEIAANTRLPDVDLDLYVRAFRRTGVQGALNWFRRHPGAIGRTEIALHCSQAIDVPALFVSGAADWGSYRKPGALERMRTACLRMPELSIAENVFVGHLPTRHGRVDRAGMARRATEHLRRLGLDVSADTPVRDLRVAAQQPVEIAKAPTLDARLLIFDEPTAALGGKILGIAGIVGAGRTEPLRDVPRAAAALGIDGPVHRQPGGNDYQP